MEKKSEKSTIALILGFIKRMQEDHIGAYAAQTAYFLIMSFIPFGAGTYRTCSVYTTYLPDAQTGNHRVCPG